MMKIYLMFYFLFYIILGTFERALKKLKSYENNSDINTDVDAKTNRKYKKAKKHEDSDYYYKLSATKRKAYECRTPIPSDNSDESGEETVLPPLPSPPYRLLRKLADPCLTPVSSRLSKSSSDNENSLSRSSGAKRFYSNTSSKTKVETMLTKRFSLQSEENEQLISLSPSTNGQSLRQSTIKKKAETQRFKRKMFADNSPQLNAGTSLFMNQNKQTELPSERSAEIDSGGDFDISN